MTEPRRCCKDCENRTSHCHCDCEEYAEYKKELAAFNEAVKKNREQAAKFTKEEILNYYNTVYSAICALKCGELTPSGALKSVTAKLFF